MKLRRVYRKCTEWEELYYNMWGSVGSTKEWKERAIKFTGNHRLYGFFMQRVVAEWPVSCENALTDYALNQKAWIGHAAVALAFRCPEHITRLAWKELTGEQQLLANNEARRAISVWKHNYRKNNGLYRNVGNQMLF